MSMRTLGLLSLLVLALPAVAGAQPSLSDKKFKASDQYIAKFLCGESPGGESRIGVVDGHYNTVINVQALKDKTAIAFQVTAISTDLETEEGVPSPVSARVDLDQGFAARILCNDIKRQLFANGQQGFVEGFATIYASRPIVVESVVTGEGGSDVSVMQILTVESSGLGGSVQPVVFDQVN